MPKIITTLRDRRQIEEDIQALLACTSELQLQQQAQRVAAFGPRAILAIVASLDTADARLLAAMGMVANYLDRRQVSEALRQAVFERGRTDQGRVAAMTILERFLGEPPGEDMLASLADPQAVALSTLDEVVGQIDGNPGLLAEYVQGLDRQQPDVVLAVIGALCRLDDRRAVEPLRLLAQDVRAEIAAAAVQAIGSLRLPESAYALQTLLPTIHPELLQMADRALRKLRFTGVAVPPLPRPDPDWRALVSPVDGLGQVSAWFIQGSRAGPVARFLNVLLSDRVGVADAAGYAHVSTQMLPPRRPAGHVHHIPASVPLGEMLMVEASFDLGRRLVREALPQNLKTQVPLAGPLRLFSPWLWGVGGADSLPPRRLPRPETIDGALANQSERLLAHPAFATWTVGSQVVGPVVEQIAAYPGGGLESWVDRLAGELFSSPGVAQLLGRRLEANSEWLMWSGDGPGARLALAAAQALVRPDGRPQDQSFVRALIRRDLQGALRSRDRKADTTYGAEQSKIGA